MGRSEYSSLMICNEMVDRLERNIQAELSIREGEGTAPDYTYISREDIGIFVSRHLESCLRDYESDDLGIIPYLARKIVNNME